MLSISEIKKYFPGTLHASASFMLREYLQHKILQLIYESEFADDLIFTGGTCLRIVHNNQRFSEDLDFDNLKMSPKKFSALSDAVRKGLEAEGYKAELKVVHRTAYHCYIRMPGLLYEQKLSAHKDETVMIRLDTEPQEYRYKPEQVLLNRFDVFVTINSAPLPLLMAQKCRAILNRRRMMGRDLFDVVFLAGLGIHPDYHYLKARSQIKSAKELKDALHRKISRQNLRKLGADVEPFLFNAKDVNKILQFDKVMEQYFKSV